MVLLLMKKRTLFSKIKAVRAHEVKLVSWASQLSLQALPKTKYYAVCLATRALSECCGAGWSVKKWHNYRVSHINLRKLKKIEKMWNSFFVKTCSELLGNTRARCSYRVSYFIFQASISRWQSYLYHLQISIVSKYSNDKEEQSLKVFIIFLSWMYEKIQFQNTYILLLSY